jgi:hypothetical protein
MSIDISPETETRLTTRAQAEGMSVDAFLSRLIYEREELAAIIERAEDHDTPEEIRAKIERGFFQSERGEVMDGETFTAELLRDMDKMERNHRVG